MEKEIHFALLSSFQTAISSCTVIFHPLINGALVKIIDRFSQTWKCELVISLKSEVNIHCNVAFLVRYKKQRGV